MPTYEYACKACDHNFEIVQSFSDDALTTCPECEQEQLRKVFSAAGIIFKGEGWHIKDYGDRKTSSSTTAAPEGGAESGSSGGDADGATGSGSDGGSTNGSESTGTASDAA